jgi:hypothetical protein
MTETWKMTLGGSAQEALDDNSMAVPNPRLTKMSTVDLGREGLVELK